MRPRSEKRKVTTLEGIDPSHVLLQVLQAQEIGGLHHEGCEGKVLRSFR